MQSLQPGWLADPGDTLITLGPEPHGLEGQESSETLCPGSDCAADSGGRGDHDLVTHAKSDSDYGPLGAASCVCRLCTHRKWWPCWLLISAVAGE